MANPPQTTPMTQHGQLTRDDSNFPVGWTPKNITTQTTTVVKSAPGVLHAITLNNPVATSVITIYDNTAASGTIIGTITVPASPQPLTLRYDATFSTGLTVKTATASSDITVLYI